MSQPNQAWRIPTTSSLLTSRATSRHARPAISIQGNVGSTAIVGVTAPEPEQEPGSITEPQPQPEPENDTQAPSVVTGLAATVVSSDSVTLSWNVDASDPTVRGYNVYRNGQYLTTVFVASYVDAFASR